MTQEKDPPVTQEDRGRAEQWRSILDHRYSEYAGDPVAHLARDFAHHRLNTRPSHEGLVEAARSSPCTDCGGKTFSNFDRTTAGGGFTPSLDRVRCVNCKVELAADKPMRAAPAKPDDGLVGRGLTINFVQTHQPWEVPYSDNMIAATRHTGPNGKHLMPHLYGTHTVLHAQKTLGKLAAVFEALDHTGQPISNGQIDVIAAMSADLMTAALRLANLYDFNLSDALVERVIEKNGISFADKATSTADGGEK